MVGAWLVFTESIELLGFIPEMRLGLENWNLLSNFLSHLSSLLAPCFLSFSVLSFTDLSYQKDMCLSCGSDGIIFVAGWILTPLSVILSGLWPLGVSS